MLLVSHLLFLAATVFALADGLNMRPWWHRFNRVAVAIALVALALAITGTGFNFKLRS